MKSNYKMSLENLTDAQIEKLVELGIRYLLEKAIDLPLLMKPVKHGSYYDEMGSGKSLNHTSNSNQNKPKKVTKRRKWSAEHRKNFMASLERRRLSGFANSKSK